MAPANPRTTLPARTNQTTPGSALWNVTSRVSPDPIPRARHARAPTAHAAHSVLVWALLHTACSSTLHKLHEHAAQRTRLGAHLAAGQPTGSPVGLELWRPAFIMLGATSTTCKLCIYNAESCHLTVDTVTERPYEWLYRAKPTSDEHEEELLSYMRDNPIPQAIAKDTDKKIKLENVVEAICKWGTRGGLKKPRVSYGSFSRDLAKFIGHGRSSGKRSDRFC